MEEFCDETEWAELAEDWLEDAWVTCCDSVWIWLCRVSVS